MAMTAALATMLAPQPQRGAPKAAERVGRVFCAPSSCALFLPTFIWRAHCVAAAVMEWRKERAAGGGEVKIVEVGGDFGMIEVAAEEAVPEEGADALAAEAAGLAISPPGAEAAVADSSEAVGAVS